jgi:hypothetical protein
MVVIVYNLEGKLVIQNMVFEIQENEIFYMNDTCPTTKLYFNWINLCLTHGWLRSFDELDLM